jgi:surface polysaccharide O-acyltransferase-like enzyme
MPTLYCKKIFFVSVVIVFAAIVINYMEKVVVPIFVLLYGFKKNFTEHQAQTKQTHQS